MTYFDQIDLINDIFDQNYLHKPDRNNFSKLLVKNFVDHFPQVLTYGVILPPICLNFEYFHQK